MKKSLLAFALAAPLAHSSIYMDFGSPADTDPSSPMYIITDEPDWSKVWHVEREDLAESTMEFGECTGHFHWVSEPMDGDVRSRGIKFRASAKIYLNGDLPGSGSYFLTIRYKDNLHQPTDMRMGPLRFTIGGENDHRWKTEQFEINLQEARTRVTPYIQVGEAYTDSLSGELHIDMMKVAATDDRSEFPEDTEGYWPVPSGANNFAQNAQDNKFHPEGEAFFPFGAYTDRAFALPPGETPQFSSHAKDSFRLYADAKMNTLVLHGYNMDWGSSWRQWPNEWPWADPLVYTELGFDEYMAQAKHHGLKVIPNTLTDTRAYWLMASPSKEDYAHDLLVDLATRYRGDPDVLAWNPVDEWDHEDSSYGKPHVQSQKYYTLLKDTDPETPVYMSLMGFMGPMGWQVAASATDIFANDKYFDESSNHSDGAKKQHAYMMEARKHGKLTIAIPHWTDGPENMGKYPPNNQPRYPNQNEIVFQAYYNITAGAQGLLYFTSKHPDHASYQQYGIQESWDGMRQVGEELFGPEGIAHALIAPSVTVDIMGENNIVHSSNDEIYHILKKDADNTLYLITVNMTTQTQHGEIRVMGLPDGSHEVRFENRSVASEGQIISDTWGKYERHVYVLGQGGELPPPDLCDVLPQHPDCVEPPPIDPPPAGECFSRVRHDVQRDDRDVHRTGVEVKQHPSAATTDM